MVQVGAKQQRFNIPWALQDVDHLNRLRLQSVNNQLIAMDAAANPETLVAWPQGIGSEGVGQSLAAIQ